jgi:hypothetical protein
MFRKGARVKACRGVPMEESRLAASPHSIQTYFHQLVGIADGSPAHFLSSVNEIGHQEWGIAKKRHVRYH